MPLFFAHDQAEFRRLSVTSNDPSAGGHVCFRGSVRRHNKGKDVTHLNYEAYEPLAASEFTLLEDEAKKRFFVSSALGVHRLGSVYPGEDAVIIAVSAEHRHEAFLAARFMIDELKKRLPIWKEEVYEDGTSSWEQGICECHADKDAALNPVKRALLAQKISLEELFRARVLLIGAGGLGCPLALNLSALGVGFIYLYDADVVEAKNLARQFMFSTKDIGVSKVRLIKDFINERFLSTTIYAVENFITKVKAREIFPNFDLIIDSSDSLATKVMTAEEARRARVPYICASVFRDEGEVVFIHPQAEGGCFSCFRRGIEEAHSCETSGVFTHSCAMVCANAAAQALTTLAKRNDQQNTISILSSLGLSHTILLSKDPLCHKCQEAKAINILRVAR